MVLNHIAAILLFSGPLLYVGLWMLIDPAGFARLPESVVRVFRNVVQGLVGPPSEGIVKPDDADVSRRIRVGFRCVGVALVLIAIVV